jgi:hypothetical protein
VLLCFFRESRESQCSYLDSGRVGFSDPVDFLFESVRIFLTLRMILFLMLDSEA